MNQDPSADVEKADAITIKLDKFADALGEGPFCFGEMPTMADVHCGPFLFRFSKLLKHYRDFDIFSNRPSGDRLRKLLASIEEYGGDPERGILPAFQRLTPVTDEELLAVYSLYSHGHKYADSPTPAAPFGGRGISKFGQ